MADYMLYIDCCAGPEPKDAYRAALVFAAATAAVDQGYQAQVALLGDGVTLMDDSVARRTVPPGRPGTLYSMIRDALKKGVKIHC